MLNYFVYVFGGWVESSFLRLRTGFLGKELRVIRERVREEIRGFG